MYCCTLGADDLTSHKDIVFIEVLLADKPCCVSEEASVAGGVGQRESVVFKTYVCIQTKQCPFVEAFTHGDTQQTLCIEVFCVILR